MEKEKQCLKCQSDDCPKKLNDQTGQKDGCACDMFDHSSSLEAMAENGESPF